LGGFQKCPEEIKRELEDTRETRKIRYAKTEQKNRKTLNSGLKTQNRRGTGIKTRWPTAYALAGERITKATKRGNRKEHFCRLATAIGYKVEEELSMAERKGGVRSGLPVIWSKKMKIISVASFSKAEIGKKSHLDLTFLTGTELRQRPTHSRRARWLEFYREKTIAKKGGKWLS